VRPPCSDSADVPPPLLSAAHRSAVFYRAHHSTETAVLRVPADILGAVDRGDLALLTLLDLSAAFEKVKKTLLHRLEVLYGVSDAVHIWFDNM